MTSPAQCLDVEQVEFGRAFAVFALTLGGFAATTLAALDASVISGSF